jgi:hypothetical protein
MYAGAQISVKARLANTSRGALSHRLERVSLR